MQRSVLQDWVMELPLREQGVLLTAVRGCDDEAKSFTRDGKVIYSPARRLVSYIRWCFLNPADEREIDFEEGSWFMSSPPEPFKPSMFGHLPQHWYSHVMHSLQVIGYRHPNVNIKVQAFDMYVKMVRNMHLDVEGFYEYRKRLSEDRIKTGSVVS